MSTTYYIACIQCHRKIWVGQNGYFYYKEPKMLTALGEFLCQHERHPLCYGSGDEQEFTEDTWWREG